MNKVPEQGDLDFNHPKIVTIENIDTRGWRRISVASGRCTGDCGKCTCVSDLQILAQHSAISAISFGSSGNPILNELQRNGLRSGKQISVSDENTDIVEVRNDIPPAPLAPLPDQEL